MDNGKNEPQGDYTSKKKALATDKAESVKYRGKEGEKLHGRRDQIGRAHV